MVQLLFYPIYFILKLVYAKKNEDLEFNRGGKTAAAPLGCKGLTRMNKFKRSIFYRTIYFRIKPNVSKLRFIFFIARFLAKRGAKTGV